MPSPQDTYLLDILNNITISTLSSFSNALQKFILAFFVFVLGWLVATVLKIVFELIVERLSLKELLEKLNLKQYFEGFEFEDGLVRLLSTFVFWFVFLIFFISSTEILGLNAVTNFLRDLLYFLPRVLAGVLILIAGFVFGDLFYKFLKGVLKGLERKSADFVASVGKWSLIVFSFLAALNQLGVANEIINTLLFGLVLFFGLAGGLSFGLGGQDLAREALENLRKKFRS